MNRFDREPLSGMLWPMLHRLFNPFLMLKHRIALLNLSHLPLSERIAILVFIRYRYMPIEIGINIRVYTANYLSLHH